MVIPWLFRLDLVCAAPCMAGANQSANQAQTKRKPSANQSANQIPHDVRSFAGRYLRRRKPSRKPNRLSPAIAPYLFEWIALRVQHAHTRIVHCRLPEKRRSEKMSQTWVYPVASQMLVW